MVCSCNTNDGTGEVNEINTGEDACNAAAACSAPAVAPVPCTAYTSCSCGCDPCQCQSAQTATPLPFYNQAPSCQESHTQVLMQQNFITAISTGYAFNMPACNAAISISIPGVQQLLVGGYLWNSVYGYLKVISFDYETARATVVNECQVGNAAPGTEIPSCTLFNVVDPPFEPTDECGEGSFLTVDFVAPAVGSSVSISVTNLIGLTLGSVVQVSTGAYTITAILSANSITLKNNGLGVTPGTTVHAYDSQGHCITPITPYSANPCSKTVVDTGALVVCHGGVSTTLNAASVGQVPVCIDETTNEVEFQTLDIPITICTYLTACLNLVSGTTTYVIVVDDSSDFAVGDLVIIKDPINNVDAIRWVVTDIVDGTHIEIHDLAAQTLNYTVLQDIPVCHVPCCEQLDYYVKNVMVGAIRTASNGAELHGVALNSGDPESKTNILSMTITNPGLRVKRIAFHTHFKLKASIAVVFGLHDAAHTNFRAYRDYNVAPIGTAVLPGPPLVTNFASATRPQSLTSFPDGAYDYTEWITNVDYVNVNPGSEVIFGVQAGVLFLSGSSLAVIIDYVDLQIDSLEISI